MALAASRRISDQIGSYDWTLPSAAERVLAAMWELPAHLRVPLSPDRIPAQMGVQTCRRGVNALERNNLFQKRGPSGYDAA
jgi:hypothetical protein